MNVLLVHPYSELGTPYNFFKGGPKLAKNVTY